MTHKEQFILQKWEVSTAGGSRCDLMLLSVVQALGWQSLQEQHTHSNSHIFGPVGTNSRWRKSSSKFLQ
jgi:hypothetical protein